MSWIMGVCKFVCIRVGGNFAVFRKKIHLSLFNHHKKLTYKTTPTDHKIWIIHLFSSPPLFIETLLKVNTDEGAEGLLSLFLVYVGCWKLFVDGIIGS